MIPRRDFVAGAIALAASARCPGDNGLGIIDTHTHFYDPTRPQGVPWPTPKQDWLYRPVLPPDFRKIAEPLGIRGTIVVEASAWVEDNQWLLDLASDNPFLLGIVGRLDPLAEEFPAQLKRFSGHPKFRGIRVSGKQFMERGKDAAYLESMRLLAGTGISLDINGPREYLNHIGALAAAVPTLRIVINHVGGAGDPQHITPAWRDAIRAAGQSESVVCKVSGLAEQSQAAHGEAARTTDYYLPILDTVWAAFGEKRLIFGSNWPVSDRGTTLDNVLNIVRPYFTAKGPSATNRYFSQNAAEVYRWP
jgi:L-fuconolactonase